MFLKAPQRRGSRGCNGIEQTAIISLDESKCWPAFAEAGSAISAVLFITTLSKSPAGMYTNPVFGNTNTLEYAGEMPTVDGAKAVAPETVSRPSLFRKIAATHGNRSCAASNEFPQRLRRKVAGEAGAIEAVVAEIRPPSCQPMEKPSW